MTVPVCVAKPGSDLALSPPGGIQRAAPCQGVGKLPTVSLGAAVSVMVQDGAFASCLPVVPSLASAERREKSPGPRAVRMCKPSEAVACAQEGCASGLGESQPFPGEAGSAS